MPPEQTMDPTELDLLVANAKQLSRRYKELTGKPLGITGEVAEYEAAKRLGLRLACARQQGFDAIRTRDGKEEHLQIKARCIAKQGPGQKLPAISRKHAWDSVIYVELDSDLEPVVMREARREDILAKLDETQSKARQRGVLSVGMFKAISEEIWRR